MGNLHQKDSITAVGNFKYVTQDYASNASHYSITLLWKYIINTFMFVRTNRIKLFHFFLNARSSIQTDKNYYKEYNFNNPDTDNATIFKYVHFYISELKRFLWPNCETILLSSLFPSFYITSFCYYHMFSVSNNFT